ncbi:MAG: hypothetical protein HY922_07820 [Elusimicrobia bacterium]|nr:hypothetical protein [Elusimicrobiota bacterium]
MKAVISIALAAAICVVGLRFWAHQRLASAQPGPLSVGLERLIGDWTLNRIPVGSRSVTLVLADASAGGGVFSLPPEDIELSAWEKIVSILRAAFNVPGQLREAREPAPLARVFSAEPDAVVWTHEGFALADLEQVAREVKNVIAKANEAGAVVNVVAQGVAAAPVFKALKSLEKDKAGAKKVIFVGMNQMRFKRIPWISGYDFSKPGNVIELANMWDEGLTARTTGMQIFGGAHDGKKFIVEELWPYLFVKGEGVLGLIKLAQELIAKAESLEQVINERMQLKAEEDAKKAGEEAARKDAEEAEEKEAESRRFVDVKTRKETERPAAQPQDSMGMIKGGGEYQGAGAAATEVKETESQPARKELSLDTCSPAWHDRMCGRCCADVGGSWRRGSQAKADCTDARSCQGKYGCCKGAEWDMNVASCRAAQNTSCKSTCTYTPEINNHFGFQCLGTSR